MQVLISGVHLVTVYHPRIITFLGQITVFIGERVRLFLRSRSKIRYQFDNASWTVLPPTNISSTLITKNPSRRKSPQIRDINSCRYSEEPGIPMGGRR